MQNKDTLFYPPDKWQKNANKDERINIYDLIFSKIDKEREIAYVIKKNGNIKNITKSKLIESSFKLSKIINNKLNSKSDNQLKILAIINSSEESLYLMISNMILGCHQCICFEDLKYKAISSRLNLFNPDIIVCKISVLQEVKKAREISSNISTPIIILDADEINNHNLGVEKEKIANSFLVNEPFFSLFTSGSTGKPKLITHQAKDYFSYAKFSCNYFLGANSEKIIFTATDAGWINGHTYAVYGPLANQSSIVICEDFKLISEPKKLSYYINKIGINCFYTSVTFLRLFRSKLSNNSKKFIYKSLERIGSCGEPLANEVGKWAINHFNPKRKTIVNTYFQTETGGILVAPRDEDGICSDYSNVGKPREELGMNIAKNIFNEDQIKNDNLDPDEIIIQNPWDGLFKCVLSEKETNYFTKEGFFRLNDVGHFDNDGYLFIGGRTDDVINTAGHRISSAEIESVALKIDGIYEACAIGVYDINLGEKPFLFISIKEKNLNQKNKIIKELINLISIELSSYHIPEEVQIFNNLPKTKSGKIMRRIMKNLAKNFILDPDCDYTTFANIEEFKTSANSFFKNKIEQNVNSNKLINIRSFSKSVGLNQMNQFILPSFINLLIEILLSFNHEILFQDIYLKLTNLNNQDFYFKYLFTSEDSDYKTLIKRFLQSEIASEACMLDIKLLSVSINCKNKLNLITLLRKSNLKDIFKIYSENSLQNNQITEKIYESFNSFKKPNPEKELKSNAVINNSKKIRCYRCQTSLDQMKNTRGEKTYFIPVLVKENKMSYICDLCLGGY